MMYNLFSEGIFRLQIAARIESCTSVLLKPILYLSFTAASYSQCKTGDEPCVVQAITNTFQKFQGGVPALGLASLDPLRIDEMDIVQGTGPVNIVLNFKNVDITGFKDVAVKKAK